MKAWITQRPLTSYFLLAYVISWSIAVPLALQAQGVLDAHLPWVLHYLTLFGPATAALIVTRVVRRESGLPSPQQQSVRRLIVWSAVGFGSPLLLFVVAEIAATVLRQPVPTWSSLGHLNFLPDLGVAAWASGS